MNFIIQVPRSRQNLVIKLWRKCITGRDRVIGFISVALPPQTAIRNEYEMSDMFISEKAPLITVFQHYIYNKVFKSFHLNHLNHFVHL